MTDDQEINESLKPQHEEKLQKQSIQECAQEAEDSKFNITDKQLRMGTGNIFSLICIFGGPAILSQLVQVSYNLVDTIFVGQATGEHGLAAINLILPAVLVFIALAAWIAVGASPLFSTRMGEKDYPGAARLLGSTVSINALFSIAVGLICLIFSEPIIRLSGATEELVPDASAYLMIYGGFFIGINLGYTINGFISACGSPGRALMTQVVAALSNIVLDWLFVIHWNMGVAGAAWATVIAWGLGLCAAAQFFFSKKSPFKLQVSDFKPDFTGFRKVLSYGFPVFAMQIGYAITMVILLAVVVDIGNHSWMGAEGALAAINVISRGYNIILIPSIGITSGCISLLAYNMGAQHYARVRKIFWNSFYISLLATFVLWIPVLIFSAQLMNLFGISTELTEYGAQLMRLQTCMAPIVVFEVAVGELFIALGRSKAGAILQIMRSLVVVCILYVSFPYILPNYLPIQAFTALVAAEPVADIILLGISIALTIPLFKTIKDFELKKISDEKALVSGQEA